MTIKKTRKAISSRNMPPKLSLQTGLIWFMALHVFNAPQWLWGVVGCLYVIIVTCQAIDLWQCESVSADDLPLV